MINSESIMGEKRGFEPLELNANSLAVQSLNPNSNFSIIIKMIVLQLILKINKLFYLSLTD